MRRLAVELGRG